MARKNGPSDIRLIARGRKVQRLLRRTQPSPDFLEGEIQHMIGMIGDAIDELRDRRPPALTLNRPRDLGSFQRSYAPITKTPEGREVFAFFKALTQRADGLGLPSRPRPKPPRR